MTSFIPPQRLQQMREDKHRHAVKIAASRKANAAAKGVALGVVEKAIDAIESDMLSIAEHLFHGRYKEAGDVFGTCLGEMSFKNTRKLLPVWHYLQHDKYAPNSSPLSDTTATALYTLTTSIIGKPPTLTSAISTMSREMSHAASMGFIYRFQSLGAIRSIKERAKERKLALPVSVREALERRTAIETLGNLVRPQVERHHNPEDPFEIEESWVTVLSRTGGQRRISIKKKNLPKKLDWELLDLCAGTGREWDTVAMIYIGLFIKHTGMIKLSRKKTKGKKNYKKTVKLVVVEEAREYLEDQILRWMDSLNRQEPMVSRPLEGGYYTFEQSALTTKKIAPSDDLGNMLLTQPRGTVQWKEAVAGMALTEYGHPGDRISTCRDILNRHADNMPPGKFLKETAILGTAARACEGRGIWFPVMMDFRGRTYYRPIPWNPQGTDLSKALLVAQEGGYSDGPSFTAAEQKQNLLYQYLAVRGLIGHGMDKEPVPPHANVNDLRPHLPAGEEVYQCATLDITDPRQLYQLDGTCNGLQHLSALMEDREGGAAVNLCDHPGIHKAGPSDIYKTVADLVMAKLQSSSEPWARRLIAAGLVLTRKDTKKQVMIIPYGAGEPTIKTLTVKNLKGKVDELDASLWKDLMIEPGLKDMEAVAKNYDAFRERDLEKHPLFTNDANKLGSLLSNTIKHDVLPGAFELMTILKEFAKEAQGRAISWRVRDDEDSLWVVHAPLKRYAQHNRTVGIHLPGMAQRLLQYGMRSNRKGKLRDHDKIDKSAIVKAIVPNFIHSHDADHMNRVSGRMAGEGRHFTSIHDCFATTGDSLGALSRIIRQTFVEKYTRGPDHPFAQPVKFLRSAHTKDDLPDQEWGSWYEAVEDVLGASSREVLERHRGLHIEDVLQSPFFFS